MNQQITQLDYAGRTGLIKRGQRLEYFTIEWNLLEGIVAIISGVLAGSISLVGFGLDSLIEVSSGSALLWRLHMDAPERRENAEAITLKIVGVCFLALAAYIGFDAAKTLIRREPPEASYTGIGLTVLSLIVMPLLARAKRRVAASISSRAMHADSRQTDLCAYLSAITLGGLGLNAVFGWWWADPIAALVMLPIIAKEGIEALRGETCCDEEACH
jgi:divalent metal cation (Fe/Co/Zn/Cd) transporter